jgi:hypothetical protein
LTDRAAEAAPLPFAQAKMQRCVARGQKGYLPSGAGAVWIRGEGNKDEDELLTDTRARSVSERKGVAGLRVG